MVLPKEFFMRMNAVIVAAGLLAGISQSRGGEVCHIKIDSCHWTYDGQRIFVPASGVAIDPEIHVCIPEVSERGTAKVSSSVMFLIDNSGSMSQYDPSGERYEVTLEILEEIYQEAPQTRVGIAVFGDRLVWDHRDDEIFEPITSDLFTSNGWNDSYFPITPLEETMSNGKTGLENIQDILVHEYAGTGSILNTTTRPRERTMGCYAGDCNDRRGGTDITLATMAAKDAFGKDTINYSSDYSRQRQFIILISDGEHSNVNEEMEPYQTQYVAGENLPTTFIIYLKPEPMNLISMMYNVRDNDYNPNNEPNKNSQLWSMSGADHDRLYDIMKEEIFTQVFKAQVSPLSASIGGTVSQTVAGSAFDFDNPNPLSPETTDVSLSFEYLIDDTAGVIGEGDTVISSDFKIIRNSSITSWNLPSGISKVCYTRDITMSYDGSEITSSNPAKSEMSSLDLELDLEDFTSSGTVTAWVLNSSGTDSVSVALEFTGGVYKGSFSQEITDSPNTGDNVLQHSTSDNIVVKWSNPDIPLDSVSKTFSFEGYDPVQITSAAYYDTSGDGLVDYIRVQTDQPVNPRDIDSLDSKKGTRINLPGHRGLTITGVTSLTSGFNINVTQSGAINTAVDSRDSLSFSEYAIGPYERFISDTTVFIQDKMAPVIVSATYEPGTLEGGTAGLRVVFSEPIEKNDIELPRPFGFRSDEGVPYTMDLEYHSDSSGVLYVFAVDSITNTDITPSKQDQVWINDRKVTDAGGNSDKSAEKPLGIKPPAFSFFPGAIPISPESTQTFPGTIGTVSEGAVIVLDAGVKGLEDDTSYIEIERVSVDIYDPVGNVVAEDLEGYQYKTDWLMHWNGRNRNNRSVQSGTYLAILRVYTRDENGEVKDTPEIRRIKVAIKK
ncbi:MAG: VWA domain-containing protein [Chitinivibrionales bacterium]|nr:VWA domain-containing protein [Chitinivibrionales bacterium]